MPPDYARALVSSKRNSEDRAEVFEHDDGLVVIVADGAGGMGGGAEAAETLVSAARSVLLRTSFNVLDTSAWVRLFADVDAQLAAKMIGETTGVLVALSGDQLAGVSAGDSEAWLVCGSGLDALTAKQKKARLGSGRASPIGFRREHLDGVLVVATDGLFKYAQPASIVTSCVAGTAQEITDRLIAIPKLRSGGYPDDVAVVVVAATPNGTSR